MEAYFAGGCFWCMAKPYTDLPGVIETTSGYCGGSEPSPTYEDVKHQLTHHRETVRIVFDESLVSFEELLGVYFYNIDPFDDGGQFIDRGRSYTCAVYWANDAQRESAETAVARIGAEYGRTVCVSIEPFDVFWPAEDDHQDYARKNPDAYRKEYEESGRAAREDHDRVKL